MFGLEMLDVLIGLITIYLSFGMACTAVVEAITAWFGVRSQHLEDGLGEFLAGSLDEQNSFVQSFFAHPLVQSLSKGVDGRPSYIAPETVSKVIEALVMAGQTQESLENAVAALPGTVADNRIKGMLTGFVAEAKGDAAAFRLLVENQFNTTMERVTGWFKRYTQVVALAVAAALVLGANVDTVAIVSSLASSPAARAQMVSVAQQQLQQAEAAQSSAGQNQIAISQEKTKNAQDSLDAALQNMETADVLVGWQTYPHTFLGWITKLIGLLVSVFAVSLGAPFWFDMLSRVMQLRTAVVPPVKDKAA